MEQLLDEIRSAVRAYAGLIDNTSRTSTRALVLRHLDQLKQRRPDTVPTRRVSADELRSNDLLRGAILIHLDLVFRASVPADEVLFTADRGAVIIATHPRVDDLPIGVILAQSTKELVKRRSDLFDPQGPSLADAKVVMPYAVAASPRKLGAGSALCKAVVAECAQQPSPPRVVTFSPLTGMRARLIRTVDEGWPQVEAQYRDQYTTEQLAELNRQLLELLDHSTIPDYVPEPAWSWLDRDARLFAESGEYNVGKFHRAMGAELAGLTSRADPNDSDALWWRAYFDYGIPKSA